MFARLYVIAWCGPPTRRYCVKTTEGMQLVAYTMCCEGILVQL